MNAALMRAVLVGVGVVLAATVAGCDAPPTPVPAGAAGAPVAAPAAQADTVPPPSAVAALAPSEPIGLAVPAVGVDTGPLIELGIDQGGALDVPPNAATAGWFGLGPAPGSRGPAVIAGHLDHAGVPGVFHRLADLTAGHEVTVTRADGAAAVFGVYRVERYATSEFPTERVYGDTDGPELRLITCGGAFDRSSGHYVDNVIVSAVLAG